MHLSKRAHKQTSSKQTRKRTYSIGRTTKQAIGSTNYQENTQRRTDKRTGKPMCNQTQSNGRTRIQEDALNL